MTLLDVCLDMRAASTSIHYMCAVHVNVSISARTLTDMKPSIDHRCTVKPLIFARPKVREEAEIANRKGAEYFLIFNFFSLKMKMFKVVSSKSDQY